MGETLTHPSDNQLGDQDLIGGGDLPAGTVLCNGQYTIEKYLNSGGFGVTYLAQDSLERKVVIKECFPNALCCRSGCNIRLRSRAFEEDFDRVVELFQKEARALARLQHPNIVGVHQIFEANNTAYMALDFITGMDLCDIMDRHPSYLSPDVIKSLVVSLLKALIYVHTNGILHRDISPDNILVDTNGVPVLIDFGASRQGVTRSSRVLSRVHTVKDGYSPQEFYFEGTAQSQSSDLYALAATIVHLITGSPPPNSSVRLAAVSENRPDPYERLAGRFPAYNAEFIDCVDTCMNLFAKDRLQTAEEWLQALNGEPVASMPGIMPVSVDAGIERKISDLVASNRKALAEDAARQADTPVEAEVPDDREAARRAAEREYWAILNEDPQELARDAERARQGSAEPKPKQVVNYGERVRQASMPPPSEESEPVFSMNPLKFWRSSSTEKSHG